MTIGADGNTKAWFEGRSKGTGRKGELGYLCMAFGWGSLQMELKEVPAAKAGGPIRMPENALVRISCGQTASQPVNCLV